MISEASSEMRELQFGTTTIKYRLSYAKRKTLGVHVRPDQSVDVIAPLDTEEEEIHEQIKRKATWILKKQRFFAAFPAQPLPRQYISGESHRFLGRQYRLKIVLGESERVAAASGTLHVTAPEPHDQHRVGKQVEEWFRVQAEEIFQERFGWCRTRLVRYDIPEPVLIIKPLQARWGSCTKSARITLNLELIKRPRQCIDYVIFHELCHLIERNHTPRFYALLDRLMPDWRQVRESLNKME